LTSQRSPPFKAGKGKAAIEVSKKAKNILFYA
jgi:hypothetical protein